MLRIASLIILAATPAMAMDKAALCENSSQVVNAVVQERAGGATKKKAVRRVSKSLEGDLVIFRDAVAPLADWVYDLPQEHLAEEAAAAYKATCLEN